MPLTEEQRRQLREAKAAPRWPDPWRNALAGSHEMTIRVELHYANNYVGSVNVVSGSVSCDRQSSVRRTSTLTIDPSVLDDATVAPRLNPYGSHLKMWRGIRYPGGITEEGQIFNGRLDAVSESIDGIELRASDLSSYVVDAKLYAPWQGTRNRLITDEAKAMILDAMPSILIPPQVIYDGSAATDTTVVAPDFTCDSERADGIDQLCTTIGCEWFCDEAGDFHIKPLPALVPVGTQPVWILDTGDEGVLVTRVAATDRQNVFNGAKVVGEAVGGETGATGHYEATQSDSADLYWGGPYGKIPQFYTGQSVRTTAAAYALAQQLVAQSLSQVNALEVTCVPNAKLRLGDVIRVIDHRVAINNLYYIQSMGIPLDPQSPMTMTLNRTLTLTSAGELRDALPTMPEGARWTTWRSNGST